MDQYLFSVAASDGLLMTSHQANISVNILYAEPQPNITLAALLPENTLQGPGWFRVPSDILTSNGSITYTLMRHQGEFEVTGDGDVINLHEFDYERGVVFYRLIISVASTVKREFIEVNIEVTDVNEFTPTFETVNYNLTIPENTIGGVYSLQARDNDGSPTYGSIQYELRSNESGFFEIDASSGLINVVNNFDYESEPVASFEIEVVARDGGGLESSVTLSVVFTDVNEFRPVFQETSYSACISENALVDASVLQVHANDSDGSQHFGTVSMYHLEYNNSTILPVSITAEGVVVLTGSVYEFGGMTFEFEVLAIDGGNMYSKAVPLSICIEMENTPPVFTQLLYEVVVTEGSLPTDPLLQVLVTDREQSTGISFYTLSRSSLVTFNARGEVYLSTPLDFEEHQELILTVVAFDGELESVVHATVEVMIYPVNEHRPVMSQDRYTTSLAENQGPGTLQLHISATDEDHNPPPSLLLSHGLHGDIIDIDSQDIPGLFNITFNPIDQIALITNTRSFDMESNSAQYVFHCNGNGWQWYSVRACKYRSYHH